MADSIDIKVRGYHLDIYGHVNNARYLEFLEEARWSFFEHHNTLEVFAESKLAFVLVNVNINYKRPGFPDDILHITTNVESIGNKSCKVSQKIVLRGTDEVVADAIITFALMDMESNKAVIIEGNVRDKLNNMIAC